MPLTTKNRTVGKEETYLCTGGAYPGLSLAIAERDGFGNYHYTEDCEDEYCDGEFDCEAYMDFQTQVTTRVNNGRLYLDVSSGYLTKGGDRAGDLYDPPVMEDDDRDKDITVEIPLDFLPLVIAELTRIHQHYATPKNQQGG